MLRKERREPRSKLHVEVSKEKLSYYFCFSFKCIRLLRSLVSFFLFVLINYEYYSGPYTDEALRSAQICSIIATLPTAVNVIPLVFSIVAAIWFQLLCCVRMSRKNLYFLVVLCMATGLALICSALFVGSDFGHYWKDQISYNYLSVACFVGGFCWILIAFRVLVFLDSDDYERWYSRFSTTNNPQGDDVVDVEANINNDDAILEVVAGNARLEAVES